MSKLEILVNGKPVVSDSDFTVEKIREHVATLKAAQVEKFLEDHDENGLKLCDHEEAPPHICPYRVDVDNDLITQCRCCDACEYECRQDV